MTPEENRLLIVEDNPSIRKILCTIFEDEGYLVDAAGDGDAALDKVRERLPHLLILDIMLPGKSGHEVCKQLKSDPVFRFLPIVMLTAKGLVSEKVIGIEAGADDYIVKPFEPVELVARVKMVLRRTYYELDANPLTRLPGNHSTMRQMDACVRTKEPFAVCYLDLDNFKAFNDKYGFHRGDTVIQAAAEMVIGAVRTAGPIGFVGHIGGDDFVVITTPDLAEPICEKIIQDFEAAIGDFYDPADWEAGYILARDRQGDETEMPLMTLTAVVVTNELREITHPAEISSIAAELKEYAKLLPGSNCVRDRRGAPLSSAPD